MQGSTDQNRGTVARLGMCIGYAKGHDASLPIEDDPAFATARRVQPDSAVRKDLFDFPCLDVVADHPDCLTLPRWEGTIVDRRRMTTFDRGAGLYRSK